jgi:hypothetical protein
VADGVIVDVFVGIKVGVLEGLDVAVLEGAIVFVLLGDLVGVEADVRESMPIGDGLKVGVKDFVAVDTLVIVGVAGVAETFVDVVCVVKVGVFENAVVNVWV